MSTPCRLHYSMSTSCRLHYTMSTPCRPFSHNIDSKHTTNTTPTRRHNPASNRTEPNSGKHWAPDMAPSHGRSPSADGPALSSIGLNIMDTPEQNTTEQNRSGFGSRPQGPLRMDVGGWTHGVGG
ncbi:hypothetical protein PMIN03_003729 [Paraphaeosphaeria minitans]